MIDSSTIKINPLNILDLREVDIPISLFSFITVDTHPKKIFEIRSWIYENLKHRFYIKEVMTVDSTNQIVTKIRIGFEDAKEISFFLLSCSVLNS
jgi:hypothetical protein